MKTVKKFYDEKPIITAIVITIITACVLVFEGFVRKLFLLDADPYVQQLVGEIILTAYAVALVVIFKQGRVFKWSTKGFFRGQLSGGYIIVVATFNFFLVGSLVLYWDELDETLIDSYTAMGMDLGGYVPQTDVHVIAFLITMIFIGIAEETIFRGVVADRLIRYFGTTKSGVVKAAAISGALFGALHLMNARSTGIVSASIQAVAAGFMGAVFAVIYYKAGTLWATIALHAYNDFAVTAFRGGFYGAASGGAVTDGMNYSPVTLLSLIPYIIVLLILIRKKNIAKIAENYAGLCDADA